MSLREKKCPSCGSTSLERLHRTNPQHITPLVMDGEKVHVPAWYVHQCEKGHLFEIDVTLDESTTSA